MRTRGLKHQDRAGSPESLPSRPMRTRGLKLGDRRLLRVWRLVASHADAWIETSPDIADALALTVASHADAWIETGGI